MDNDGDFDLAVGNNNGTIDYFENTGTPDHPDFAKRTGPANPFNNVDAGSSSKPEFVDLDGDGDFDIFIGNFGGDLDYFENTGTQNNPEFTQRSGIANPLSNIDLFIVYSSPTFADTDGDGDLDLIVGSGVKDHGNSLHHYENIGTVTNPRFTDNPTYSFDFDLFSHNSDPTPVFADIDGDGDPDLVVGGALFSSSINYFEHTVTRASLIPTIALTLYDTNGTDTLDLRTDTVDQRVDLRPEGISDVYGLTGNLIIARDTVIENIVAGSGNDEIMGNDADNRLDGGAGADILNGGDGVDTVSYIRSDAAVTVRFRDGTGQGGHAEGDVITGIENIIGSDYADIFGGDSNANRLSGLGGDDGLWGSSGDDILEGGADADRMNGGLGEDTASYESSNTGVVVRLHSYVAQGGHAEGDTFIGRVTVQDMEVPDIEHLTGSSHNDILAGDLRDNTLKGRAGDDTLYGGPGGGDDWIYGENGNDRVFGGKGNDTITGGAGDDTLSGGADDDTFVFAPGDGDDTIMDFGNADDRIDLRAFEDIDSINDLSMEQQGDNVVIDLSEQGGGTIILSGFDINDLSLSDFLL